MPLFELTESDELVPFRQLHGGAELYEREIEDLLWSSFEELLGESLFPVARQPVVGGGRPDLIALDENSQVVIVEVKRDVDRGQLAQCLEYAGWARDTHLDELASVYHQGRDAFFADWQEFMESSVPMAIRRPPRLVLVARDFHGRTESAFEFLVENDLPVKLIRVAIYEDEASRKFVDIEGEHEPYFGTVTGGATAPRQEVKIDGRRIRLSDLVDAGLLLPG